ncbi:beta-1,6-N-acetylglucosaminyltransferase [Mucilaginibacter aquatilis]|uniref:Peptide O-xylosyltransferase n=1 Tax=Mucilaginibacter aquatilis TaxID=1517760 RepID=A0A6I4IB42_9SPHI|nr:beta-1,6-N-acetylglucosaminyltransferase [Mucilaginibacter aquatilis]MVN90726.1 glycosyl transferase [Mucilaginibacter aquatilis]
MRIAHLILAHNNPQHLELLVKRLSYGEDAIFIHIDKKVDLIAFKHLEAYPNVVFVKNRVKVGWGAYSIVEATLSGFKEILAANLNFDVVNLLSGCDYPLKTPQLYHQFLQSNKGKIFMEFELMHSNWKEALCRIERYHLTNYEFKGKYALQNILNRILPKRRLPGNMVPVGRSQWFTAPAECIKYLVDFMDSTPGFKRFIEHTWAPDEFVFQTILYNSPYRAQMVNDNLRYIDWSEGKPSPKTFTIADKEKLLCCDKLFARKFDAANHSNVIQAIDDQLDNKGEQLSVISA